MRKFKTSSNYPSLWFYIWRRNPQSNRLYCLILGGLFFIAAVVILKSFLEVLKGNSFFGTDNIFLAINLFSGFVIIGLGLTLSFGFIMWRQEFQVDGSEITDMFPFKKTFGTKDIIHIALMEKNLGHIQFERSEDALISCAYWQSEEIGEWKDLLRDLVLADSTLADKIYINTSRWGTPKLEKSTIEMCDKEVGKPKIEAGQSVKKKQSDEASVMKRIFIILVIAIFANISLWIIKTLKGEAHIETFIFVGVSSFIVIGILLFYMKKNKKK